MKKLLAFPLALALLLPLCACGAGEAGETASPAVSVSVQTVSQDCRSGDAADVVLLHYADDVPTVTIKNGEAAQTAINTALQELVSAFSEGSGDGTDGLNAYLNMAKSDYAQSADRFLSGAYYAMERHVSVARGDNGVLSLVYSGFVNLGGAHSWPFISAASFDLATGAKLAIDDLSGDAQTLKSYCLSYITDLTHGADYADVPFTDGYEQTLSNLVADGPWYLSADGLVFAAGAGDIAPYAAGEFRFTVPYDKIGTLLRSAYLPASNRTGNAGGIAIADTDASASPNTVGSTTLSQTGRAFSLTAGGTIYDVALSCVDSSDGLEFTTVGTRLYFSELSDGQTVGVQAVIPEGMPNLCISWRNADGTAQSRLISESGKDGSLLLIDYRQPQRMNYAEITDALPYAVDLDGDSANETVEFVKKQVPDESDMQYAVRVTDGGKTAEYQTQIISDPSLWCADVDYDGVMELLLSGNVMSDDYVLWCLKYRDGALTPVPIADSESGKTGDSTDCWIERVDGEGLMLGSAQDVLGSYGALRQYEYADGALRPAEGSVWTFSRNETWLKTVTAVPAAYDDGLKGAIPAGTSILLTSTDGVSWVRFVDGSGGAGAITIARGGDYWGWSIAGSPDTAYFESLPYAG